MNPEEPLPSSSQVNGQQKMQRLLKVIVIVMGLVLIGGFAVIVGTIVYRAGGKDDNPADPPSGPESAPVISIDLPEGAEIVDMTGVGGNLALRVRRPDSSEEILIVESETGNVVRRIPIE